MKTYRSKGLQYLYNRFIAGDPEAEAYIEKVGIDMDVAQALYDLRTQLGLTQTELAKKAGTTHSVISRLEDSDYRGHSVAMLRRIGDAVGFDLVIGFVPKGGSAARPAGETEGESASAAAKPAAKPTRRRASKPGPAVPAAPARKIAAKISHEPTAGRPVKPGKRGR